MAAPIALSDAQITTIMQLSRPLAPAERTAFVELLAAKLNGRREIGDGELHRLVRTIIRDHHLFDAPADTRAAWDISQERPAPASSSPPHRSMSTAVGAFDLTLAPAADSVSTLDAQSAQRGKTSPVENMPAVDEMTPMGDGSGDYPLARPSEISKLPRVRNGGSGFPFARGT